MCIIWLETNFIKLAQFIEVTKTQQLGRVPPRDNKFVDIYREKPIKASVKVLVPVREHPKVRGLLFWTGI